MMEFYVSLEIILSMAFSGLSLRFLLKEAARQKLVEVNGIEPMTF
ncbi:hypothetical protein MTBPR1_280004 [Candidatus Terasakiella magnetica]|uniref:Uncharacterized protein n=1 Tax=Candidatus Terasakiella magnetica TaxID=1867952 RepID=A0A1C3RH53_9PROT|nr:hypothetical protein MTBPR1_280004 [Candidatus Terasakiella magnetica]